MNHLCSTGGCRGSTCLVNVSCKSLLWSKMSLISRTVCWWPGLRRFHRSSMMCRMPLVFETHSIKPQLSCRITTLNVTRHRLRRRASGFWSSNWLTMVPNIIMRESLRKSPLRSALTKKGYSRPSLPRNTSFLGRSFVLKTSKESRQRSEKSISGNASMLTCVSFCDRIRGTAAVICRWRGTSTFQLCPGLDAPPPPSNFGKDLDKLMVLPPSGGFEVARLLRSCITTW
mmetsp:Transcript_70997/g.200294  ORF Transcript_70997/g.200294 Transcript_70997/m.200294 type:complete len:229 (-) Transcript_70997:448-1134(-)